MELWGLRKWLKHRLYGEFLSSTYQIWSSPLPLPTTTKTHYNIFPYGIRLDIKQKWSNDTKYTRLLLHDIYCCQKKISDLFKNFLWVYLNRKIKFSFLLIKLIWEAKRAKEAKGAKRAKGANLKFRGDALLIFKTIRHGQINMYLAWNH